MEKFYETFTVEQEVLDKWAPILEGTGKWKTFVSTCPKIAPGDHAIIAQLLENTEALKERTNAGDVGDFSPILIPMLRRVMPSLIGMQIFGTQPMSGPTGLIFALRAVFQNDTDNPIDRTNSQILTLDDITLGVANYVPGTPITSATAEGVVRAANPVTNTILVELVTNNFAVGDNVENVTPWAGPGTNVLVASTPASAGLGNEALVHYMFPDYTGTNAGTGASPAGIATDLGENLATDMKEIGFTIETDTVTATTRKLKAKWTLELEQDLMAIHNMNAERLLNSIASDEIVMEMNREFMDLVAATAGTNTTWDYNVVVAGGGGDPRWELEGYQALVAHISRQKRNLAVTNKRGMANWAIVSTDVLSALEASGRLSQDNVDPVATSYAGKALGMDIYVDLYSPVGVCHLGYKGPNEIDAGIYYCPYIPLQIQKGFGEEDGQPRTFFHTRYGIGNNTFGAGNYYHTINVDNLPT